LLIQGTKDELYSGTLEYAARLEKTDARYELILLEGAPHGMENWEGHPEWAFYKQKLVGWLSAILGHR
jgi:acetyl esterase/lipase